MSWFEERFTQKQGRLELACAHCSRQMWFPPSKHGLYKTCGDVCTKAWRDEMKSARAKHCKTCGEVFVPRLSQIRQGHGQFCSQRCNTSAREALLSEASQEKARAKRIAMEMAGLVKHLRGPDSPRWNGGKEAAAQRRRNDSAIYKKNNPDKVRAWSANRRAKYEGRLPHGLVKELFRLQRGSCVACKAPLLPNAFHLDHIQPLARGGKNIASNMQLLCKPCNLHKAAKDPVLFMQSKGFLL